MKTVKFRIFIIVLVLFASSSIAYCRWENATNIEQEPTGDAFINRCTYQTLGGYRFFTDQRGICKFSVQVDPESGQVKTSQTDYGASTNTSRERWENATNVGQEPTGDAFINRCTYQTLGGYRFSTDQRGICKFTVQVNPESGQVKTSQTDYGASTNTSLSRWERATNVGQEPTGDALINRCIYQTLGGYKFSTDQRGICKFSVEVNTENQQVR